MVALGFNSAEDKAAVYSDMARRMAGETVLCGMDTSTLFTDAPVAVPASDVPSEVPVVSDSGTPTEAPVPVSTSDAPTESPEESATDTPTEAPASVASNVPAFGLFGVISVAVTSIFF